MKRADAERKIVRIYRYGYLKQPDAINASESPAGALHFYGWLRKQHPELLEYRCSGDQYQDVAGMVEDIRV